MIGHKMINDLKHYFESLKNERELTSEESVFLMELSIFDDCFPISAVTRSDLDAAGFKGSEVTDDEMERLADKMGDDFCEQLYWSSLEIIGDFMGLQRSDEVEEDEDE